MNKEDLSLLMKSTLALYGECLGEASKALISNWILLPAIIVLFIFMQVIQLLVSGLGIAGGFIIGLAGIAFMTLFYSWIEDIVRKSKLKVRYMGKFDTSLFFSLISFAFIFWIFMFALQGLAQGADAALILTFVLLITVIILNPIAEIIYIHRYDGVQSITHAARFTLDNWFEWLLPLIIILLPFLLLNPLLSLFLFSRTHPLLSGMVLVHGAGIFGFEVPYLAVIIGLILATWYTLFRGFLFLKLDSSSRRQRIYRAKQQEV